MRALIHRLRRDERGAGYLAAFIVLFSVLLVAGVGLLVDSARVLSADRQCTSIAFEAARAGANALNADALRAGEIVVDPGDAQATAAAAAGNFASGSGATLQSVVVDGDRVTVVVSATVGSWFPLMSDRTVTQRVTARAGPAG
jgi:Flp pilus assembly protein TadG